MPHFSRLTDIITCSLTEILEEAADPAQTLREILEEINEGLSACSRTVRTSAKNTERLRNEILEYQEQITEWKSRARELLTDGNEEGAREALQRKGEVEDLIAGLRPELEAASATFQNMHRIQKALEARRHEAVRKMEALGGTVPELFSGSGSSAFSAVSDPERKGTVEAELEALRQELSQS